MSLILASASPRRAQLLQTFGIPFVVRPPHVNEDLPIKDPSELVTRLGEMKARALVLSSDSHIIAADTIVMLDQTILGKPADRDENRSMLQNLAGREHQVYGSIALLNVATDCLECRVVVTSVRFRKLCPDTIEYYLASNDGLDKAGGYGIQGLGSILVERIEGCYDNVVGLSRSHLYEMLVSRSILKARRG